MLRSHFDILAGFIKRRAAGPRNKIKILDLGAGAATYWRASPLEELSDLFELHVVDMVEPGEEFNGLYHHGDVLEFARQSGNEEFDFCVAFDLIEHLPKHVGFQLMYEMERISGLLRGVFTPNGFIWQPPSPGGPWNAHVSGWTPKELKNWGFDSVFGHIGPKALYGPYALPRFPRAPIYRISRSMNALVSRVPALAFSFSAWRLGRPRGPHLQG